MLHVIVWIEDPDVTAMILEHIRVREEAVGQASMSIANIRLKRCIQVMGGAANIMSVC